MIRARRTSENHRVKIQAAEIEWRTRKIKPKRRKISRASILGSRWWPMSPDGNRQQTSYQRSEAFPCKFQSSHRGYPSVSHEFTNPLTCRIICILRGASSCRSNSRDIVEEVTDTRKRRHVDNLSTSPTFFRDNCLESGSLFWILCLRKFRVPFRWYSMGN